MAVTVDALGVEVGSGPVQASSPLDVTAVITVGSGAKALLVTIVFDGTNTNTMPTSITCTWDQGGTNQAMTQVGILDDTSTGANNNADGLVMFGLLNPTAGNKTIRFTWTGATISQWDVSAMSFIGNDLTSIANAFQFATSNSPGTSNATSTITATSAVGAITVCLTTENFVSGTLLSSPNHTQLYSGNPSNNSAGVQYSDGASSLTFTWTLGTTTKWNNLVVSVMPAADVTLRDAVFTPRLPRQYAQVLLPYNQALYSVIQAPFSQTAWGDVFFPQTLPIGSAPLNINLFTNPIPFGPFDLSDSVRFPLVPQSSQPYNQSLYTVTITLMGQAWI